MKKKAPVKKATKPTKKKEREVDTPASAEAGTPDLSSIVPVEIPRQDGELMLAEIAVVFNARTEFDEAYINGELAPSIRQYGVQNRLWVYPLDEPTKDGAEYGLIAGEQRWRAAAVAGLLKVPVTIYACDEQTALELGLIDNIQRRNLKEIDEAFAYAKLIKECGFKAWDPSDPPHSIGHKLNISKTKVYALLKLTELPKLGVDAVRAGQLSASVAVRIARIPNRASQERATQDAIANRWTDDHAAHQISNRWMTELKGAPFDRKDKNLNPERGDCGGCPFRSGNQAEMFPDLAAGRGDICMDPDCFRGKCMAAFDHRAQEHRSHGGQVLQGDEAEKAGLHATWTQIGGAYAELDDYAHAVGKFGQTYRELLKPAIKDGSFRPILALANDGSGRHFELVTVAGARRKLEEMGVIEVTRAQSTAAKKADREREGFAAKVREAKVIAICKELLRSEVNDIQWLRLIGAAIVGVAQGRCDAKGVCLRHSLEPETERGWEDWDATLEKAIVGLMDEYQIKALITEYLLDGQKNGLSENDQIAAFGNLVRIDLEKIAEGVRLVSKKPGKGVSAKDAEKVADGKAKAFGNLGMTPEKRAEIAAAQRARWAKARLPKGKKTAAPATEEEPAGI